MDKQKMVCVDLDGTIAHYKEWEGEDHFGEPVPGARDALGKLRDMGWTVIIYTTRSNREKIRQYLEKNSIPFDYINESPSQPANAVGGKLYAQVYVDDRAIQFNGNWQETLAEIIRFKPWEEGLEEDPPDAYTAEAISFLARDFTQSFDQMRHYDVMMWDITKFTFGELIVAVAASWAIYSFATNSAVPSAWQNQWPLAVATLLGISYLLSLLAIFMLTRLRLYFVVVARYVNEHRHFFLLGRPLGFPNESGMYTDHKYPSAFDRESTQMVSIYVIALVASMMLAFAVGVFSFYVIAWVKPIMSAVSADALSFFLGLAQLGSVILSVILGLLSLVLIIWFSVSYLKSKEKKTADEAVFGVPPAKPRVEKVI